MIKPKTPSRKPKISTVNFLNIQPGEKGIKAAKMLHTWEVTLLLRVRSPLLGLGDSAFGGFGAKEPICEEGLGSRV